MRTLLDDERNMFDSIRLSLADPETIRSWAMGEVKKPETINYRTLKPEKDGLFCEKIFGPVKDFECACGKYKRTKFKGIFCERCGVEVTHSRVRRERMGYIDLAAPVVHIWYFRGTRSRLAYLLSGVEPAEEIKSKPLERVIYFAANIVTKLDEEEITRDKKSIQEDISSQFILKQEELLERVGELSNTSMSALEAKITQERESVEAEVEAEKTEKSSQQGEDKDGKSDKSKDDKAAKSPVKLPAKTQKALDKLKARGEDLVDANAGIQKIFEIVDPVGYGSELKSAISTQHDFLWVIKEYADDLSQNLTTWLESLKAVQAELDMDEIDLIEADLEISDIKELFSQARELALCMEFFFSLHPGMIIDDENLWESLVIHFGDKYFEGGMGAEAILNRIENIDFDEKEKKLRELLFSDKSETDEDGSEKEKKLSEQRRSKALKTLKIVTAFNQKDKDDRKINNPKSIILQVLPVIPPDLRPMVELDGGRFATSDQNDLYRRVINRNNRLRRLQELNAPEIIINNEKRMLQEAVDALLDNGRRGRPVTAQGGRPLKSLSDTLKGKQGRFRQNLLGKRVDYSGRSVIVAGPALKLHQCGLPKLMAMELFKPFIMKRLVDKQLSPNMKSAQRMLERREAPVWGVLADVIKEHPVLLNRAPTLHRLGIQAFEPMLVEGKAIQVHPLVCAAFNADFDGDQMAVHIPLSAHAKAEARLLMLSAHNILSPANGHPLVTPSKDMLVGAYYLTVMMDNTGQEKDKAAGKDKSKAEKGKTESASSATPGGHFRNIDTLQRALDAQQVGLHDPIEYRIESLKNEDGSYQLTSPGRVLFNEVLPDDFEFVNATISREKMGFIIDSLAHTYLRAQVAICLDDIKDICFDYATRSGLTISVDDIPVPGQKQRILDDGEREFERAEKQFNQGLITALERDVKEIEIWNEATNMVRAEMEEALKQDPFNSLWMMLDSGARANMTQVRQMAGMRGLMNDSNDDPIPRPIKSNLREGLSVLEYFITTIGARKGLVDVARRTPLSGYFTRRLVDVAQEVVINSEDPLSLPVPPPSITIEEVTTNQNGEVAKHLTTRLFSRVIAEDITLSNKETLPKGTMVTEGIMKQLANDSAVSEVKVLSPLTDDSENGIAPVAYGMSFATGNLVEPGEAVGIVAAQSLGEASTQFTLRTFHTGGDRTDTAEVTGLERVDQLLDARKPGDPAILAPFSGKISILPSEINANVSTVILESDEDRISYEVDNPSRHLNVENGDKILAGEQITKGLVDPHELLALRGLRETQLHLVKEMQKVYKEQGANIHDKHIELIVRQMTRWVEVETVGDTQFMPGDRVETRKFRDGNAELVRNGLKPAEGRPVLLGIKQAPLAGGIGRVPLGSESWLAPASYEYVIDVLTEAAIGARKDSLKNLKENVAVGKLIPAGTGMARYRENVYPKVPGYEPMESFSAESLNFANAGADSEEEPFDFIQDAAGI